jgi:ankyrin repeat protein
MEAPIGTLYYDNGNTELTDAIINNNLDEIEYLILEKKVNVNEKDKHQNLPLQLALSKPDILKFILENGNINKELYENNTSFQTEVLKQPNEIFKLLVKYGFIIYKDITNILLYYLRNNNYEMINFILDLDIRLDNLNQREQSQLINEIIKYNNPKLFHKFLLLGIDPEIGNYNNNFINNFIYQTYKEFFKMPYPQIQNKINDLVKIIDLLMIYGSDPTLKAITNNIDKIGLAFISYTNVDNINNILNLTVIDIYKNYISKLNLTGIQKNLLHMEEYKILKSFLDKPISELFSFNISMYKELEPFEKIGMNPFMIISFRGYWKLLTHFIPKILMMPNFEELINLQDKDGNTALIYACVGAKNHSDIKAIKLLLDSGANKNISNKKGYNFYYFLNSIDDLYPLRSQVNKEMLEDIYQEKSTIYSQIPKDIFDLTKKYL